MREEIVIVVEGPLNTVKIDLFCQNQIFSTHAAFCMMICHLRWDCTLSLLKHSLVLIFQCTRAWFVSVQNPSCSLRSGACLHTLLSWLNSHTCIYLVEEICSLSSFSQDKDSESSQVRTGKWKVPSSQNYLALFKSLLDCDRLKVRLCSC